MELTQNKAKELFEYRDGELFRKTNRNTRFKTGQRAGCLLKTGYRIVEIDSKAVLEHRIIYLMHYGYLPKVIDHIDGNTLNNKIENLREATIAQNCWNTKRSTRNTSGNKGIFFRKDRNVWTARICVKDKNVYLGYFKDKENAIEFMQLAREMLHGSFAKHN